MIKAYNLKLSKNDWLRIREREEKTNGLHFVECKHLDLSTEEEKQVYLSNDEWSEDVSDEKK